MNELCGCRSSDRSAPARTLYIIDAPNMAHRAAAVGVLRPTLGGMVQRFLRVAEPQYVVAVWDDRDASFRRDLWPAYKADRHHDADVGELMAQAREVMDSYGLPAIAGRLGVEADDLIATLATLAPPDVRVVMLSTDKDLLQLVDHRTFLASRRGGASTLYRADDVRREYGVEPRQWPAVMALAGVKNGVPGLPGVGLKGACTLLAKYGDLETLLRCRRAVAKRSHRLALESHAAEARLYLDLMTLRRDVPIDWRPDLWRLTSPDPCGCRSSDPYECWSLKFGGLGSLGQWPSVQEVVDDGGPCACECHAPYWREVHGGEEIFHANATEEEES